MSSSASGGTTVTRPVSSRAKSRRRSCQLPRLGYHHALIITLGIVIVLISILIAGCTSENLSSIYLLSLSYANNVQLPESPESLRHAASVISDLSTNHTSFEVRAGYLGICLLLQEQTVCSRSRTALETFLYSTAAESLGSDPLNLIYTASKFQEQVIFVGLLFATIVFAFFAMILLFIRPRLHDHDGSDTSVREVNHFLSKSVNLGGVTLLAFASFLSLISSFWQHLSSAATASMAELLLYDNLTLEVGAGAMALGWISTFLLLLSMVAKIVMVLPMVVLSQLTNDG